MTFGNKGFAPHCHGNHFSFHLSPFKLRLLNKEMYFPWGEFEEH